MSKQGHKTHSVTSYSVSKLKITDLQQSFSTADKIGENVPVHDAK